MPAILKRKVRGLKHIRTLSGRYDGATMPSKIYMKLSCLEQEKLRLEGELEKIAHRVEDIEARAQEIEAEKAALLKLLGEGAPPADLAGDAPRSEPRPRAGGIKLRY
jgi:predicted nuclease with TOPRIM domain